MKKPKTIEDLERLFFGTKRGKALEESRKKYYEDS
jgi:hypothetical protein